MCLLICRELHEARMCMVQVRRRTSEKAITTTTPCQWGYLQYVFGLVDILDIVTYDVLVHLPLEFLFFRTGCVVGSRCAFGHLHDRA